jgi:hypothetical protein
MRLSQILLQLLSGEPLTHEDRFQIALAIVRLVRETPAAEQPGGTPRRLDFRA